MRVHGTLDRPLVGILDYYYRQIRGIAGYIFQCSDNLLDRATFRNHLPLFSLVSLLLFIAPPFHPLHLGRASSPPKPNIHIPRRNSAQYLSR